LSPSFRRTRRRGGSCRSPRSGRPSSGAPPRCRPPRGARNSAARGDRVVLAHRVRAASWVTRRA
jgi:hypothetical protein